MTQAGGAGTQPPAKDHQTTLVVTGSGKSCRHFVQLLGCFAFELVPRTSGGWIVLF